MTDLSALHVAAALTTRRYGRSLELREETGSTNDDARAAADAGCPDGHVVVADHQRAGRGSSGRGWDSPPGVDLYFSIVARTGLSPDRLPPLTLAVGLGVARAIEVALDGASVATLKWPNDVLLGDRKVCGILVETVSVGARVTSAVIGVGVGVNRARFAPPLDLTATSLRLQRGAPLDRSSLLASLLGHIEEEVDRFIAHGPAPIARAVDARLAWRGARVRLDGREVVLRGVTPDGGLRIEGETGPEVVRSGRLSPPIG